MRKYLIAGSVFLMLGCGDSPAPTPDPEPEPSVQLAPPAAAIDAEALMAAIEKMSSDEFGGRAPGSEGERLTVEYLTDQFHAVGLEPGNPDGTWVQNVPLVGITPLEGDDMTVTAGDQTRTLTPGADYVAYTKRVVDQVEVDAEFVFVGYGAIAPEYEWDDFKGVDVSGKILLFLVNDPPSDDLFGGPAMTYYGRWTYKHEIAAAQGAAGALVIHETGPAGYPWEVIGSSPYGESFDLVADDQNMGRVAVEGWIQRHATAALFEMAGLDFETEKAKAAHRLSKGALAAMEAERTALSDERARGIVTSMKPAKKAEKMKEKKKAGKVAADARILRVVFIQLPQIVSGS